MGGDGKFSRSGRDFFKNCTWSAPVNSSQYCDSPNFLRFILFSAFETNLFRNWTGASGDVNIFVTLSCFIVIYFFMVIVASTLPIPAGIFGPSFTLGAGKTSRIEWISLFSFWQASRVSLFNRLLF